MQITTAQPFATACNFMELDQICTLDGVCTQYNPNILRQTCIELTSAKAALAICFARSAVIYCFDLKGFLITARRLDLLLPSIDDISVARSNGIDSFFLGLSAVVVFGLLIGLKPPFIDSCFSMGLGLKESCLSKEMPPSTLSILLK